MCAIAIVCWALELNRDTDFIRNPTTFFLLTVCYTHSHLCVLFLMVYQLWQSSRVSLFKQLNQLLNKSLLITKSCNEKLCRASPVSIPNVFLARLLFRLPFHFCRSEDQVFVMLCAPTSSASSWYSPHIHALRQFLQTRTAKYKYTTHVCPVFWRCRFHSL